MTLIRQFLARAILIDFVIYRDLWDKYVLGVPKRSLPRVAKPGRLQEWVDGQVK